MCICVFAAAFSTTVISIIYFGISKPAEVKQWGVMVRSCNTASLIPEPLSQSCQISCCALLPCLPTFLSPPSPMREEYKCLQSLKPSTLHPSSFDCCIPSPTSTPPLCLPLPIPGCSPPRTAKDIFQSEIRMISADTTWQRWHGHLRRSHAVETHRDWDLECIYLTCCQPAQPSVMCCTEKPSIFVFLNQWQGRRLQHFWGIR